MKRFMVAAAALFLLTSACTTETVRVTARPTAAPTTAAPTPTPTRTPSSTPAAPTPTPTAAPTTAPTTSPGSTPPQACSPMTGGSAISSATVTAIRAAHQPGFDRLVFELSGPSIPQYRIELASGFTAPSGQAVRVDGNAFFSVRISGQAHTDSGSRSYPQPDPYNAGLSVLRQVKLVEDFEGVVIFGLGMERAVCPNVQTLLGPSRIVIDFPAAP